MLENINMLREKLEQQVLGNESYDLILATSKQIDNLLVEYYRVADNYNLALIK